MADDLPPADAKPISEGVRPDAPPPSPAAVTTAPAASGAGAAGEARAPFDLAAYSRDLLRKTLLGLLGGAVGAAAGILLFLVLGLFGFLHFSWLAFEVAAAAGVLVGLMFNRFILRVLRLLPKAEKAAEAKAAGRAAADGQPQTDGFREVIETVVFVVVLVLLLKSFAAEAFVIPTGSMAETLYGYQKNVKCPQCGYEFPVNCSQEAEHPGDLDYRVLGCTCPNCRRHILFGAGRGDTSPFTGADAIPDPQDYSGDRVLVAKFVYDLFETLPDRLDVVVFKFPGDDPNRPKGGTGRFPETGPVADGAPMNYIKRLVGLPGDLLAIHGGRLYVLSDAKVPEQYKEKLQSLKKKFEDDEKRALQEYKEGLKKYGLDKDAEQSFQKLLWRKPHMHADDPDAKALFDAGAFEIIRKKPDTMLAMRRIVYDNDHPAKDLIGVLPPRWADRDKDKGAGWTADGANGFALADPADDRVHWLGYSHILRSEKGKDETPQPITDFIGYDTQEQRDAQVHTDMSETVRDLMLECEVQPGKAQGQLTFELAEGPDRYRARFDLANGNCSLLRVAADDTEEELKQAPTALRGGGTHTVRFANFDERLTVWVDEALPFGDGVVHDPPKTEKSEEKYDLKPAGVGLRGAGAAVRRLKLWRDTYYTTMDENHTKPDTRLLYVQPGHYLCMGDNSPASSDSRFWGLVPERLLLGKALMVYYPFDRFGRIH